MSIDKKRIIYLYERFIQNEASDEEKDEFYSFIEEPQHEAELAAYLGRLWFKVSEDEVEKVMLSNTLQTYNHIILQPQYQSPWMKRPIIYLYALAVVMILLTIVRIPLIPRNLLSTATADTSMKVLPGEYGATLQLAGGQRLDLSKTISGAIAVEGGVAISNSANQQISYTAGKSLTTKYPLYNILSTRNGQYYRVLLPDSTMVWLNAGSALRFPVSFSLSRERIVYLQGEAYFEVAKDPAHPFIVQTSQQFIKVLGTHFNVTSYPQDGRATTTLLEGALSVKHQNHLTLMKAGQQFQTNKDGTVYVQEVDPAESIAWKDGYFIFNEDLHSILKKISRWYDVDIQYNYMPLATRMLKGKIGRNRPLSEVLSMLEFTGNIHFQTIGRRVIVKK